MAHYILHGPIRRFCAAKFRRHYRTTIQGKRVQKRAILCMHAMRTVNKKELRRKKKKERRKKKEEGRKQEEIYLQNFDNMVNKCVVSGCMSNHPGYNNAAVFSFPKDQDLFTRWKRFCCRNDFNPTPYSRICILHFEPQYIKKGDGINGRCRLNKDF